MNSNRNKRAISVLSHPTLSEFRSQSQDQLQPSGMLTGKHSRLEVKSQVFSALSGRSKAGLSTKSKISFSHKSKNSEIAYNKWYIRPSKRLQMRELPSKSDKTNHNYIYKDLYKDLQPDPSCPFRYQQSEKLRLLDLLPKSNFSFLEEFKRSQMKKKKRVPEIVQMLIRKKRAQTEK